MQSVDPAPDLVNTSIFAETRRETSPIFDRANHGVFCCIEHSGRRGHASHTLRLCLEIRMTHKTLYERRYLRRAGIRQCDTDHTKALNDLHFPPEVRSDSFHIQCDSLIVTKVGSASRCRSMGIASSL